MVEFDAFLLISSSARILSARMLQKYTMDEMAHDGSGTAQTTSVGTSAGDTRVPTCIIVLGMAGSGKTTFVQVSLFCTNLHIDSFYSVYCS